MYIFLILSIFLTNIRYISFYFQFLFPYRNLWGDVSGLSPLTADAHGNNYRRPQYAFLFLRLAFSALLLKIKKSVHWAAP
jgi:hypothetical protein